MCLARALPKPLLGGRGMKGDVNLMKITRPIFAALLFIGTMVGTALLMRSFNHK
jgi:hypothetical protein